jgi:hypothetical protein
VESAVCLFIISASPLPKAKPPGYRAELFLNPNDIHRRHRSPHSANFSKTSKTELATTIQNIEYTHFLPLTSASGTSYGCFEFILLGGSR